MTRRRAFEESLDPKFRRSRHYELVMAARHTEAEGHGLVQAATLVDLVIEQELDQPDGRTTATSVLQKVRDLCTGAPELVNLATAALAPIGKLPI
ncbi:hypothetical protein [Streptacidiphilus sp. MAP5-3]|uniref:hypothetical protein n=1 Tax=unclassified Streptacidiphilus TaxID=2643834 RepID=UPI003515F94A